MRRIVVGITSLEQHIEAISASPERYRPRCCPHCGLKILRRHGYYYRKSDRRREHASLNPVPICRYLCSGCHHTCLLYTSFRRRALVVAGADSPLGVEHVELRFGTEKVLMGLEIRIDRPHVAPVRRRCV